LWCVWGGPPGWGRCGGWGGVGEGGAGGRSGVVCGHVGGRARGVGRFVSVVGGGAYDGSAAGWAAVGVLGHSERVGLAFFGYPPGTGRAVSLRAGRTVCWG
jgi:hypothetical protein